MMKLITIIILLYLSQLNSLGWLRGEKEARINNNNNNNNNNFQNALDDSLNYQTIEKDLQNNIKIKALY